MDITRIKQLFIVAVGAFFELFLLGLIAAVGTAQSLVQLILFGVGVLVGVDTWRIRKQV
jgi:hypothetical protein